MNINNKLKLYCKICQRFFRDKDALKCHLNSFTHKKKLEKISNNVEFYIENYTNQLKNKFKEILRRKYKKCWVNSNDVYNDYVSDRENNIYLNSTKYKNLNDLIIELKNENIIKMKANEDGIFIYYDDNTDNKEKKKKKISLIEKINVEMEKIDKKNNNKNNILNNNKNSNENGNEKNIKPLILDNFNGFEISFNNNNNKILGKKRKLIEKKL